MIRILGPIDVLTESGEVVVPGRHERMILGILAVTPNRAVRVDDIAELLWDDTPPRSTGNAVQTCVSRLRTVVGHDRIDSVDHSYRLQCEPVDLDSLLFEHLVSEAAEARHDTDRCLGLCTDALAMWRGQPFGDFADEDPFRLEVIRLDELRLYALEMQLECELERGNGELVVGTLECLVQEYPYRERLWQLLISALAAGGRRVEALRACKELRTVLGDVGLEPGNIVADLEDAILSDEPDIWERLQRQLLH